MFTFAQIFTRSRRPKFTMSKMSISKAVGVYKIAGNFRRLDRAPSLTQKVSVSKQVYRVAIADLPNALQNRLACGCHCRRFYGFSKMPVAGIDFIPIRVAMRREG